MKTLKAKPNASPSIDSIEHNDSPEFANELLDELLRRFTLDQIEAHTGISRRNVSYLRQRGIKKYATQLALEILAGRKALAG